jgi:hypothetical protein
LTVDLEALLEEADEDKSGFIDYKVVCVSVCVSE